MLEMNGQIMFNEKNIMTALIGLFMINRSITDFDNE